MTSVTLYTTAIIKDRKGRVLAIKQNSYLKTHPYQAHHANKVNLPEKIFLHAEIHAIVSCKDVSKAYSIEVLRVNKQGKPMMAKPCPICMSAISATNIKLINWSK
jgi:tRNA(Arg) A34 adenosine deaminase TadA